MRRGRSLIILVLTATGLASTGGEAQQLRFQPKDAAPVAPAGAGLALPPGAIVPGAAAFPAMHSQELPPPRPLPAAAPRETLVPVPTPMPVPSAPSAPTTVLFPDDPTTGQPYQGYPITYPVAPARPIYRPEPGVQPVMDTLPGGAPAPAAFPGAHTTGPCRSCFTDCDSTRTNPLLENLGVFFGLQGSKEPYDLGVNAHFGYRSHIDWGIPLVEELGLGLHLAAAYNHSNNAVRVLRNIEASRDRHIGFFTLGMYRRNPAGLNWEVAWDFRSENYHESIDVSQWRGLVSWKTNDFNEVGVWGTWRDRSNTGEIAGQFFILRPINQANFFWRHYFENDATTTLWVGLAEEHGRFSLVGPPEPHVHTPITFGADFFVPLTPSLALYGEAQFLTPNDTGAVTAMVGFVWYPGASARHRASSRTAPLLPAANNTNFLLDLQRN